MLCWICTIYHVLNVLGHLLLEQAAAESASHDSERVISIVHLAEEQIVPVSQARLVIPQLADHGVLLRTEDALGLRVAEAALVVRVLAHEVDGGEVELAAARGALRDLEHLWLAGVGEVGDLLLLGGRFAAVRLDEGFVLMSASASYLTS